eukprot:s1084_g10.t3
MMLRCAMKCLDCDCCHCCCRRNVSDIVDVHDAFAEEVIARVPAGPANKKTPQASAPEFPVREVRDTVLLSGRFTQADKVAYMRDVEKELQKCGIRTFMVKAGAGQDFGVLTAMGLQRARAMVAFCTSTYGERTRAGYETYQELKYVHENGEDGAKIALLPIKLAKVYPPCPPDEVGRSLCTLAFPRSLVYVDGLAGTSYKQAEDVAKLIVESLRHMNLLHEATFHVPSKMLQEKTCRQIPSLVSAEPDPAGGGRGGAVKPAARWVLQLELPASANLVRLSVALGWKVVALAQPCARQIHVTLETFDARKVETAPAASELTVFAVGWKTASDAVLLRDRTSRTSAARSAAVAREEEEATSPMSPAQQTISCQSRRELEVVNSCGVLGRLWFDQGKGRPTVGFMQVPSDRKVICTVPDVDSALCIGLADHDGVAKPDLSTFGRYAMPLPGGWGLGTSEEDQCCLTASLSIGQYGQARLELLPPLELQTLNSDYYCYSSSQKFVTLQPPAFLLQKSETTSDQKAMAEVAEPEFKVGSKGKKELVDNALDKKFRGSKMDNFFKVSQRGSNLTTEIRAGITTFLTAAYIMAVNPNIISTTGLNFDGLVFATAMSSCIATLIMALWANLPFGLWPGMGMNAYFAYTIVGFKGTQNAVKKVMMAVTVEGVIFIIMSALDLRRYVFKVFPTWMMKATMAGIGLFLAHIGLQAGNGIDIVRDHPAVLVDLVTLTGEHFARTWIGIAFFCVMSLLILLRVKGAVMISILLSAILCWILSATGDQFTYKPMCCLGSVTFPDPAAGGVEWYPKPGGGFYPKPTCMDPYTVPGKGKMTSTDSGPSFSWESSASVSYANGAYLITNGGSTVNHTGSIYFEGIAAGRDSSFNGGCTDTCHAMMGGFNPACFGTVLVETGCWTGMDFQSRATQQLVVDLFGEGCLGGAGRIPKTFNPPNAFASVPLVDVAGPLVAPFSGWGGCASWLNNGVCLADVEELSLSTGPTCKDMRCLPADQFHENCCGFCFTSFQRLREYAMVRTVRPFASILRGFVSDKVTCLGFEPTRLSEVVVTLWDPVAQINESRAVTLVNMSADESDWIFRTHSDVSIDLDSEPKLVLLAELRQSGAAKSDWQAFRAREAFDAYLESLIRASGLQARAILHRTNVKDGYLAKRVQIPKASRNFVYKKSGQNSIQFRAARLPGDPQEENIEVLRVYGEENLASYAKVADVKDFSLGVFASQGAVYTRVLSDKIAQARQFWFPNDERFDEGNIGVKCKLHYRVQGLPSGITLKAVREVSTNLGCLIISREDKVISRRKEYRREEINHTASSTHAAPSVTPPPAASNFPPSVRPRLGASLLPPPPPNPELLARVEMLEQQMGEANANIKTIQVEQTDMKSQLSCGFRDLMQAIQELKEQQSATSSSANSPLRSPPSKLQKK